MGPDRGHGGTARARYIAALTLVAVVIYSSCLANTGFTAPAVRARAPHARAVYVRDAGAALVDPAQRAHLARLVAGGFGQVIFYGLRPVLADPARERALVEWLTELRRGGVTLIAPVGGLDGLPALLAFSARHPRVAFDALVTEHEFWNADDRAAAFTELTALVEAMRAAAIDAARAGRRLRVGAYLGHPTAAEAHWIAGAVDFVYLDYSVASPARAWSHVHGRGGPLRERFVRLASAGVDVWPIFYAAGEVDMGAALRARGLDAAEAAFLDDLAADREARRYLARLRGFVYFTLEALP